jgi:hypothetical protein
MGYLERMRSAGRSLVNPSKAIVGPLEGMGKETGLPAA